MRILSSTCHPVAPISSTILTVIRLDIPIRALGTPITIRMFSGADAASIQGVVDLFRPLRRC